eukprot:g21453.t1
MVEAGPIPKREVGGASLQSGWGLSPWFVGGPCPNGRAVQHPWFGGGVWGLRPALILGLGQEEECVRGEMAVSSTSRLLNGGARMPLLGLGTWKTLLLDDVAEENTEIQFIRLDGIEVHKEEV